MASAYTEELLTVCGGCEEDMAAGGGFSGLDCQQFFCTRCIQIHERIQSVTSNNVVSFHQQVNSNDNSEIHSAQSTNHVKHEAQCKRHKTTLSVICETCLVALCQECRPKHEGHELLQNIDSKLLHRVNLQRIPGLVEILIKLDTLKDGSSEKLNLYKTARDMVHDCKKRLLKIVNDDSDALLNDIDIEIKKQEILYSETMGRVPNCIAETDHAIRVLSNARQISDTNVLLRDLYHCEQTVSNTKQVVAAVESMRTKLKIEDILPFCSQLQKIEADLRAFLKMTKMSELDSQILPKIDALLKDKHVGQNRNGKGNKTVSLSERELFYRTIRPLFSGDRILGSSNMKGYALRISETNHRDTALVELYNVRERNVFVFNTISNNMKILTFGKDIYRMATLDDRRYVIRDENGDIHVVDERLTVLHTLERQNDFHIYQPYAICRKSDDTFIVAEITHKTRLREVVLKDGKLQSKVLCVIDVNNMLCRFMSCYPDGEYVLLSDGDNCLAKVHLTTGQCTTVCLSEHIFGIIESFCIAPDDGILVCDYSGDIHKMVDGRYEGKLRKEKFEYYATGIAVRKGAINIVSEDFMIHQINY